jgi:hypothetical protein
VDADTPATQRGDQLAAALTSSLTGRRVLCDLMSAQAAVLERNLSAEVAASYKRSAVADVASLADVLRVFLPELDEGQAQRLGAATVMVISAVWTHAQPSAAMLEAYEADPSLAAFRLDFSQALTEMLQTLIAGTLARARR